MRVYDIISESKQLDEKPVGALKNIGQKLKAKGAGMLGMKDTKAGIEGGIETNNKANATYSAFRKHLGKIQTPKNQVPAEELQNWLKSMKMSTMNVPNSGVIDDKAVSKAILQSTIDTEKQAPTTVGATAPSAKAATQQTAAPAKQAKQPFAQKTGGTLPPSMDSDPMDQPKKAAPSLDTNVLSAIKKLSKSEKASLLRAIQ